MTSRPRCEQPRNRRPTAPSPNLPHPSRTRVNPSARCGIHTCAMLMYLLFLIPPMLIGLYAQRKVTTTFRQYSEVPASSHLTGAEVARAILDRNGLHDVEVIAVPGELSDHYDPRKRTVNLSEPVYGQRSLSAVAVAAHEVGHAMQHARKYAPLAVRSAIFPAAAFGTNLAQWFLMGGMIILAGGSLVGQWVLLAGIVLYSLAVMFQLVTLPVEFDASRRAKLQLRELAVVQGSGEAGGASKVLSAAAMTYVAAALAALSQLIYFVMIFLGNRD